MKKRTIVMSILSMALLSMSLGYAWYHNNRLVGILGGSEVSSIKIRSNGVLQAAYAAEDEFSYIPVENASFSSALEMRLSGNSYEDVSGNGMIEQMYSPILDQDGKPQADSQYWKLATADNAADDKDSGQYIIADLYFRSDDRMDIYLLKESSVLPRSENNGEDLTNRNENDGSSFSDFQTGLPDRNINQSSYGLFSRNLIAGATRVSFAEYDFRKGTFPTVPGMIWVPNTTYELKQPDDPGLLRTMNMDGTEESSYRYFQKQETEDGEQYTETVVKRRENNGSKITGELYRITDSGLEAVSVTSVISGQLVPGLKMPRVEEPIPAIWAGDAYIPAAPVKDAEGKMRFLAAAAYNEANYQTNNTAFISEFDGEAVYVRQNSTADGYIEVTRVNSESAWGPTGREFTGDEAQIIEEGFQTESGTTYQTTVWLDTKRDFNQKEDNYFYSDIKIGTTDQEGAGFYYTRVRIAIWVEGTDREANIALNGGEFDINLQFYGVSREEEGES